MMRLGMDCIFAELVVHSLSVKIILDLDTGFETGFLTHKQKLSHPGLLPELIKKAKGPGNSLPKECFTESA